MFIIKRKYDLFKIFTLAAISLIISCGGGGGGGGGSAAGPASGSGEASPAQDSQPAPIAQVPDNNTTPISFTFSKDKNPALASCEQDIYTAVIDDTSSTISLSLPFGTDRSSLIPDITLPANASINPASSEAKDFTSAVVYTVTAADGTTSRDWTVNVEELPAEEHVINYNLDEGNWIINAPSTSFTEGESISLPVRGELAKDNYIFTGWHEGSSEGPVITGWNAQQKTTDISLYATWAPAPLVNTQNSEIYANGHDLIITSYNSGTAVYVDENKNGLHDSNEACLHEINNNYPANGENLSNYTIYGGNASYVNSPNVTSTNLTFKGGKVANVYGGNKNGSLPSGTRNVILTGSAVIGDKNTRGVYLGTLSDNKLIAKDLSSAQAEAITLIADHSNISEGTTVATFAEGTADAGKFKLLRDDTHATVNVNALGNDIVTIGSFGLPDIVTWSGNDDFTVGTGNINSSGTIFSVIADGGYLTVTETTLAGANFDMGIPLDENYKENGYDNTLSANKKYRYIQFTSETGNITAKNADTYLSKIRFHSIRGASVKVRINLETLPITGAGYTLNQDVFYFDGSFYKKSAKFNSGATSWPAAYAAAKKMTFNGLKGYLMTITSDAENKFVYDQVFKGQNADDVGSWIGGTRQTSIEGYDKDTWTAKTSKSDYTQNWVWACGPEAGKVFYTKAVYQDNNNYRADGMYSSWSNPKDCDLNGIPRAYNDDYEPNNQADGNHSSSNPDTITPKEYYTQYTGRYVWNDASNGTGTQPRWQVHYYIVEFTPYEATAYGPGQRATKTALHAEREYSRN